ncbi:MAG TPA: GNAT family N-acetyltransferase [Thermoplasmata archaeon]|nr:GNAT family N-acetyltransferase [Thermoplasmata archaeon]
MPVREFTSGDGQPARRLWDDLGGWYRHTSPTSDADVDRAIGRLLRHALSGRRASRGEPAEAAWVAESNGSWIGWLYARADPEQNYIVPLVPSEDATGAFDSLLAPAREWFHHQEAGRFVVDVPDGRADLRTVARRTGRVLWHRAVLDRDLRPLPAASAAPATVREFRRSDLAAAQTLFGIRHPEKPPPPIPVAFLELRGAWSRDPAWELQRTVWIAGPRNALLGVAGGTHRPGMPVGFLGPWVLSEAAGPGVETELLGAVLTWLRDVGARRVRTTIPTPPGDDAQRLLRAGFSTLAESDLFELKG